MQKKLFSAAIILPFVMMIAACGGDDNGGGNTPGGISYTVTFDVDGGTTASVTVTVTAGGTVTLPAEPSRSGYTFTGWWSDESGQFTAATPVTQDITVYTRWTAGSGGDDDGDDDTSGTTDGSLDGTWVGDTGLASGTVLIISGNTYIQKIKTAADPESWINAFQGSFSHTDTKWTFVIEQIWGQSGPSTNYPGLTARWYTKAEAVAVNSTYSSMFLTTSNEYSIDGNTVSIGPGGQGGTLVRQ